MQAAEIKALIQAGLPDADIEVSGDDGVHFQARVVSAEFIGKPLIKQHKLVYATLGDRMQTEAIHALALKTLTPEQSQAAQGSA